MKSEVWRLNAHNSLYRRSIVWELAAKMAAAGCPALAISRSSGKDSDSSWREKGAFIASHAEMSAGPEMSVTFHVRAMNAGLRSLMNNNVTNYTVSR